jgi:hypothetical protein
MVAVVVAGPGWPRGGGMARGLRGPGSLLFSAFLSVRFRLKRLPPKEKTMKPTENRKKSKTSAPNSIPNGVIVGFEDNTGHAW